MEAALVRIRKESWKSLKQLAAMKGQTMQAVLEEALEAYRRHCFFEDLNASVKALQRDPKAWNEELEERKDWDATLMDGLDSDERWTDDGRVILKKRGKGGAKRRG